MMGTRRWIQFAFVAATGTLLVVPTSCEQALLFFLWDLLGIPHIQGVPLSLS